TVMAASEPGIDTDGAMQKLSRIKAIVAASSGNLVEWYDFYAYAFTSIYFAAAFFPSGDQTSQLLATAGIFAVGFFMRPLGGWLFGWIADDRNSPHLPDNRRGGAGVAALCADGAGPVGWRRVWNGCNLYERDCR